MGFIARNLRNPALSFTYTPEEFNGSDRLVVRVDKGRKVEIGAPHEFLLNFGGKAYKVVGVPTKKLLNKVFVQVTSCQIGDNRFPKLDLSDTPLSVELIPEPSVKLKGEALDFSLGGSHIRLEPADYGRAKELADKNPIWEALYHLDTEDVKILGVPSKFNDADRIVSFVFSHNPNNYVIVDLYEELLKRKKEKFLHSASV